MAYCKKCGAEIDDQAVICPKCGVPQSNNAQVQEEGSGIGWGILGAFIPLVGLILFLCWNNSKPKAAKASGIGALIGFVLGLVMVAV